MMRLAAALALGALPWCLAHAARPLVTDDARLVEKDHCQIETLYKDQRTYTGSEFWWIPGCNPGGFELNFGVNRIEDESNGLLQFKYLFKELPPNGFGLAASTGFVSGQPYVNGIASFSFFDEHAVVHANAGRLKDEGSTWGLALEALVFAPRVYGVIESYGERGETPTWHYGVRYWVVPNRLQLDVTRGDQRGDRERRFYTLGARFLF